MLNVTLLKTDGGKNNKRMKLKMIERKVMPLNSKWKKKNPSSHYTKKMCVWKNNMRQSKHSKTYQNMNFLSLSYDAFSLYHFRYISLLNRRTCCCIWFCLPMRLYGHKKCLLNYKPKWSDTRNEENSSPFCYFLLYNFVFPILIFFSSLLLLSIIYRKNLWMNRNKIHFTLTYCTENRIIINARVCSQTFWTVCHYKHTEI